MNQDAGRIQFAHGGAGGNGAVLGKLFLLPADSPGRAKARCCPHGKADPNECKTQGLRNFVKAEQAAQIAFLPACRRLRPPCRRRCLRRDRRATRSAGLRGIHPSRHHFPSESSGVVRRIRAGESILALAPASPARLRPSGEHLCHISRNILFLFVLPLALSAQALAHAGG